MDQELTPTSNPMRMAAIVAGAGAFGGLLSWIHSQCVGGAGFPKAWWAIPASMILGLGSSLIGVYVIARPDTRRIPRCVAVAVLCGFAWRPVYAWADTMVKQSAVNNLSSEARETITSIEKTKDEAPSEHIRKAATLASQLMETSSQVGSSQVRANARETATDVLLTLTEAQDYAPEDVTEAVARIGKAAVKNDDSPLALAAVDSLASISEATTEPSVVRAAVAGIGDIAKTAESGKNEKLADRARQIELTTIQDAVDNKRLDEDGLRMAIEEAEEAIKACTASKSSDERQEWREVREQLVVLQQMR